MTATIKYIRHVPALTEEGKDVDTVCEVLEYELIRKIIDQINIKYEYYWMDVKYKLIQDFSFKTIEEARSHLFNAFNNKDLVSILFVAGVVDE